MTIDQIRNLFQAHPFQPFVMHLADGRQIPVMHHDFIIAAPSGRTVIVYQPDASFNIVDTLLVTDFEVNPNGQNSAT